MAYIAGDDDKSWATIDASSASLIQGLCPGSSLEDRVYIQMRIISGELFPGIRDESARSQIFERICSVKHIITTIYTFLEDNNQTQWSRRQNFPPTAECLLALVRLGLRTVLFGFLLFAISRSWMVLLLLNLPPSNTSSSPLDEKSATATPTTDFELAAISTSSALPSVEPIAGNSNIVAPTLDTSLLQTPASEVPTDGNYAAMVPMEIYPAQDWAVNDGPWYSFAVKVGTPPQTQKLFISTSARNILLAKPSGCLSADTSNCATLRGGIFNPARSTTWVPNTARGINATYPIFKNPSLGYNSNGTFGFDDVAFPFFGTDFSAASNQNIGGFSDTNCYLGLFGIYPRSTTFSSSEDPVVNYLLYMFNSGVGKQQGSLILGGYDQAKFNAHDITWPFNSNELRDLTLNLQSITAYGWTDRRSQASLLPSTILAFLDSTLPYIWLPLKSCLLFEQRFGPIWDAKTELYLVNETSHDSLTADDPSMVFTLNNGTFGFVVNIILTYALLDLTVSSPIVGASTRYFPLKRASSPSQYILGRTFFQAAYVIADYERGNFSVHSIKADTYETEEIWPINSPNSTPSTDDTTGTIEPAFKSTSNVGPTVGGTIGGMALKEVLTLIYFIYVRPRRQKPVDEEKTAETSALLPPPVEVFEDPTFVKPELDNDTKRCRGVGRERSIYELPAMEEVRIELRAENYATVELASPIPQTANEEVTVIPGTETRDQDAILPDHAIPELDAKQRDQVYPTEEGKDNES
ncbi:aspartic peptidase domain-containing protein [Leptodontidium sp. MPI-SDFR-AT-0119]|nr:aspartic peptidase domain-containing protein [Leptodontidium sp. MPI-SDFR-AT-0119]